MSNHPGARQRHRRLASVALAASALGLVALPSAAQARPAPASAPGIPASDDHNFNALASFDVTTNGSSVAEIIDISGDGTSLYYTDAEEGEIGHIDIADPAAPVGAGTIATPGEPTSLVVAGDHLLAAVNTSPDFVDPSGVLVVIDTADDSVVRSIDLAGQPDSIALSPLGDRVAIVIENERDEDLDDGLLPQLPSGALQVLDTTSADPADWTISTVDLSSVATNAADGTDLEPEFVDVNADGIAVVTFQENNHLAVVDLDDGSVVNDFAAGSVDLVDIDTEEDDLISYTDTATKRREPDAVAWIDTTHFATANEGDYEDAEGEEGGSRGFTVFDVDGDVTFESNSSFELAIGAIGQYNEGRSENKGVEPESVEYGTFGETPFLFVGSERSNIVGIYDVTDPAEPALHQLIPTGIGPEGLKAIPGRDLFVASTETSTDDIPAMVNIFEYQQAPATYPQIMSTGETAPIPWVALSGLVADPDDETTLYAVSDAFLAEGYVYTVDVSTTPATITERTTVTGASTDLDLEGIAIAPEGGFWLANEGDADGIPNAIIRTDAAGVVVDEIGLPADLEAAARSNGFEGLAVTGDATTEYVYAVIQRAWPDAGDADKAVTRIARYDVAAETWSYVFYPLDAEGVGGWVGLSEITALPNGNFAVIERDKGWGESTGLVAANKRVYEIDLADAGFATESIPTITKTVAFDALPALREASTLTPEKLEGLAVTASGATYLVTDNDGLDDATGETVFLSAGPLFPPLPAPTPITKLRDGLTPVAGDFDGDGIDDVFLHAPGAVAEELLLGDGERGFDTQPGQQVLGTYTAIPGDFDGDGMDDIVFYAPGPAADHLWTSNGDGTFASVPVAINGTYRTVVGDFDGDGADEIVFHAPGAAPDFVWSAVRAVPASRGITVVGDYQPSASDVDGDGDDDINWHAAGDASDYIWLGDAALSFPSRFGRQLIGAYQPFGGDFDGDGVGDTFLYRSGAPLDYVLFGTGTPGQVDTVTRQVLGTYRIATGDFDGDGEDDVFFVHDGPGNDSLWWSAVPSAGLRINPPAG